MALLVGGTPTAFAACAIAPTTNQTSVSNSANINCIAINGITVTNAVTNTSAGVIAGSPTGILINNSAIGGGIVNAGKISGTIHGIWVTDVGLLGSSIGGGISNSGTISGLAAIQVEFVSTFTGGITNKGLVSAGALGIAVENVPTFAGGISNAGTISAGVTGIAVFTVSTFAGGISNNGTISAGSYGIVAEGVSTLATGIGNSGTISAGTNAIWLTHVPTFVGGISNGGVISAGNYGIWASNVVQFGGSAGGGITNTGTISADEGIAVSAVSTFVGGVTNTGTISAGVHAIWVTDVAQFGSSVGGGISNSGAISGLDTIQINTVSLFVGGISNGGTISAHDDGINLFNVQTFAGGIGNSGTIAAKSGIGIIILSVATVGGEISNSGTISGFTGFEAAGSGAVSIFDSGAIIGTGGTAVDLSGNAAGNTLTLGPGYGITGKVLGQGSDTLQLGGTGSGSFDLGLIGPAQQYEGFTTFNVVSAIWTATGTFSGAQSWNVNGGTLAGTGTFAGINVNSGGTLEPGTPGAPGTFMTLNGNLTFHPGANYLVNISPTTASRANVAGAVTLAGAVEGYLAPGSYSTRTTYDILDPSSISGTFTGFTAINAPGFAGTLTYNGSTDVLLNLTAQLGLGSGLNENQRNAANTINTYFNSGGTLPASFLPVFGLNGPALGNALTQIDGEDATGAERGAFDLMNEFLGLMLDPFVDGRGGSPLGGGTLGFAPDQQASLPPDVALAYAGLLKAQPAPTFNQRWSTWAAGFGGSATANGDPVVGSNNVTTSTYGYAAGLDYHVSPDTVVGFSLAGGGTNWNLANALGTGRSDALLAGIYGVTHNGPWYFGGALAFANNWFSTSRTAFAGDQLTASFQGQSYAARLEGGYRFAVPVYHGAAGVTPYAAIQAQNFHTPSYSETDLTGGGFGLSYNAMSGTDTRSELGSRFDDLTALGTLPLILRAKLAWAHDWVSNPALNASFESLPGTAFTVNGAAIPHDTALTSIGGQLFFTPNWSFLTKFDGEFAGGYQLYAGSGTLRYTW